MEFKFSVDDASKKLTCSVLQAKKLLLFKFFMKGGEQMLSQMLFPSLLSNWDLISLKDLWDHIVKDMTNHLEELQEQFLVYIINKESRHSGTYQKVEKDRKSVV